MTYKSKFKIILPVIVIIIIFISLLIFMNHHDKQEKITTKLVYKTLDTPNFSTITPIVNDLIRDQDFHNKVSMLTFLGSWCVACTVELPILKDYVSKSIPIYGLDFDEQSQLDILRWLKIHQAENIFTKISYDNRDTLVIDLGVTGAPESFILNKQGKIVLHVVGIISKELWLTKILPLVNNLKGAD